MDNTAPTQCGANFAQFRDDISRTLGSAGGNPPEMVGENTMNPFGITEGTVSSGMRKLAAAAVFGLGSIGASAAPTLPPPAGLAVQYDDFYSYSTQVLNYLFPTAGWDASAGTGTLDVIITTRSSGQTNSDIAGDVYKIPDPITNPNTTPIAQSWGGGPTAGEQMLVKDLYSYLMATFQANTPVFTFDQNETGGNPDLLVSAVVEIIDNFGAGAVLSRWAFDNSGDNGALINSGTPFFGQYDPGSPVTAPGSITIPDSMNTCPGNFCTFNNNRGSGQFDYIVYAPSMNLTPWANDPDAIFKVSWVFANVDDGGEEITLTGRFTGDFCVENPNAPQCQTIPEPGTLALAGLGLIGLWGLRRRIAHRT